MDILKSVFWQSLKKYFIDSSITFSALALVILSLIPGLSLAQAVGRQRLQGHVPKAAATAPLARDLSPDQPLNLATGSRCATRMNSKAC